MDICDEIKIAQAEWIIKHTKSPKQVILPLALYRKLLERVHEKCIYRPPVWKSVDFFGGMKVYEYKGNEIVFS